MLMHSNIHIADQRIELEVDLDLNVDEIKFNTMVIKGENFSVDIYATKDQLKQIADEIYKAFIDSAES